MRNRLREFPRNLGWLALMVGFWCLLWGGIDLKNVLGGLLVAMLVFVLFPMPPLGHELTLRPLHFAYFLCYFLFDLVKSAIEVGWWSIRPAPQPPSSVVAVKMASRSDFFLTATGVLCTIIPGSVVVEAQRATGLLFLHVIGAGTPDEVEAARQRALAQERRLLLAMGRRELREEAGLQ